MYQCEACKKKWTTNYCPDCASTINRDELEKSINIKYDLSPKEKHLNITLNNIDNLGFSNINCRGIFPDEIYEYVTKLFLIDNLSYYEVVELLIELGINENNASNIVEDIRQKINDERKDQAILDLIYGLIWCAGGLFVTFFTYNAASGGGVYVVFWGAILYGAIRLFRGLAYTSI